jgi:hypothetical protein
VTGQRSKQNAGRLPVAGHMVTQLSGSIGPILPSGHVVTILLIGADDGKAETSSGGATGFFTGRFTGGATGRFTGGATGRFTGGATGRFTGGATGRFTGGATGVVGHGKISGRQSADLSLGSHTAPLPLPLPLPFPFPLPVPFPLP